MTKKISALCMIIFIMCQIVVLAEKLEIINGDFESPVMTFTGVNYYDEVIFDGNASGFLMSPQNDENGDVYHSSEYMYTVRLEEGKLYNFTINIRSFDATGKSGRISAQYNTGNARIYFNIRNIGTQWSELTCPFIAGTTGDFDIGINVYTGEGGALIDNISVTQSGETPVKMEVFGNRNVYVPDIGYRNYTYEAAAVDKNGSTVPIIKGDIIFEDLPKGVIVSDDSGAITVTADAEEGEYFTVKTVKSSENAGLTPAEVRVYLGKNLIENGSFSDLPRDNGFTTTSGVVEVIDTPNGYAAKMTEPAAFGEGYVSGFMTDPSYVLYPGKMYVFRATVYSDGVGDKAATVSNEIMEDGGNILFKVRNIPGNEADIYSVLKVENEGIYKIRFEFENEDERDVYIRNIGLFIEESKMEEILIKAPSHITIPESEIKIPIICAARDQEGVLIEKTEGITVRAEENKEGVSVKDNVLYLNSSAKSGEITLVAESPDKKISKKAKITINGDSIGDGSFEKMKAGEWVSTAAPSHLEFTEGKEYGIDGFSGNVAKLTLNGDVSAILFDSVNLYKAGQVYVFGGSFKRFSDSPTMLSLLLCEADDIYYTNTLPCLQSIIKDGEMRMVFMPNRDITGRIMIGFNTLDKNMGQEIIMDGIYTDVAEVSAENVSISGYPYEGMVLSGKHKFISNFEATEISTYRWLSSSTKDGMYMPIEGETGDSLSVSEKLVGSYVKFEVTPISLSGPVFGESKMSSPVLISFVPSGGAVKLPEIEIKDDEPEYEETNEDKSTNVLNVVNIHSASILNGESFVDIQNHWAKDEIEIMSASSVVNGMGNMLFMPDKEITRAQFSAFIIRAFSLAPLHYSGTFDDVKAHNWYSGAVETVTKYAIANGVSPSMFAPDEPVTREQMTVMIVRSLRLAGISGKNAVVTDFKDAESISDYAKEYVNIAAEYGIVAGFSDGTFRPKDSATRAEAVVLIKRMIEYVLKGV